METKHWILIGIVILIVIGLIYFVFKKKPTSGASASVNSAPGSTQGGQTLTIQSAQYFWPGDASSSAASKDVTGVLQGLISGNMLDLNAGHTIGYYNQIFGDPYPNKGPKQLRVLYDIGGATHETTSTEDQELKINT